MTLLLNKSVCERVNGRQNITVGADPRGPRQQLPRSRAALPRGGAAAAAAARRTGSPAAPTGSYAPGAAAALRVPERYQPCCPRSTTPPSPPYRLGVTCHARSLSPRPSRHRKDSRAAGKVAFPSTSSLAPAGANEARAPRSPVPLCSAGGGWPRLPSAARSRRSGKLARAMAPGQPSCELTPPRASRATEPLRADRGDPVPQAGSRTHPRPAALRPAAPGRVSKGTRGERTGSAGGLPGRTKPGATARGRGAGCHRLPAALAAAGRSRGGRRGPRCGSGRVVPGQQTPVSRRTRRHARKTGTCPPTGRGTRRNGRSR